jgi:hypothetical protein
MIRWLVAGLLVVLAVFVVAGCGGGPDDSSSPTATYTATPRDTSGLTEEMRRTVLADPGLQEAIGDRVEGVDYWIDVVPYRFPIYGEDGGTVKLLFKSAASFSGEIYQATDPCSNLEMAYRTENLDPCQKEHREFKTTTRDFQTRAIEVWVDILSRRIYNINSLTADPVIVDNLITELAPTQEP